MSSPVHTDVGNRIQKSGTLADCSKTEKGPQAQGLGTLFLIMVGDTGIEPCTHLLHIKQALLPVKTKGYEGVTLM